MTLKYLRQYVSQRYLANEYNIAKSTIAPIVKWTVKILIKRKSFSLPNKVKNINDNSENINNTITILNDFHVAQSINQLS